MPLASVPRGGRLAKPHGWSAPLCIFSRVGLTGNLKPKVSGGQTPWPADHMARPAGWHLVSYQLNHLGTPSMDLYKYPPTAENKHTTLYL
jgi:hypothetical protein